MDNIGVILGSALGSTVIAAIVSGGVALANQNNQGKLVYITGERSEWRKQIREIAQELASAQDKEAALPALAKLKVRINAYGQFKQFKHAQRKHMNFFDDEHIWEIISDIENELEGFQENRDMLIAYLGCLLKYDWERSKDEVLSNRLLPISVVLMILGTGLYLYTICLAQADLLRVELIFLVGFFISFSYLLILGPFLLKKYRYPYNFSWVLLILGLICLFGLLYAMTQILREASPRSFSPTGTAQFSLHATATIETKAPNISILVACYIILFISSSFFGIGTSIFALSKNDQYTSTIKRIHAKYKPKNTNTSNTQDADKDAAAE